MIEKLKQEYLLITVWLLSSCAPQNTSANKSGISMEVVSVATFIFVGMAILIVYNTTKKK